MTGHGEKLSRKQDQAITALLTYPSITAAAQQCDVAEGTLRRWLKQDGFQIAYREARRQVLQGAIVMLQASAGDAVQTLTAVMADGTAPASAKVAAARTVLDTAIRATELESVEERLAELERRLDETGHHSTS